MNHRPCPCGRCPLCVAWDTGRPIQEVRQQMDPATVALQSPPPPTRSERCRHLGRRTEFRAGCNGWMCAHDCDQGLPAVPGGYCQTCPEYQTESEEDHPMPLVVNMSAGGLGDALLGLLAVRGLADDHPGEPLAYRVHPAAIPFVALFDGGYTQLGEHDYDDVNPERLRPSHGKPNRHANLDYERECQTRGEIPRVERYRRNIGASSIRIPPLRNPDRIRTLGDSYTGSIVLAPFSAHADREYHLHGWRVLAEELRGRGYRVVITDARQERCDQIPGSESFAGRPADEVAGLLLNAAVVVGNDSGIAHLAGLLGTPTLALCGQTSGRVVFTGYHSVKALTGRYSCSGCFWQGPDWTERNCSGHCANLQTITPESIAKEVDEIVLPKLAGGRAVLCAEKLHYLRQWVLATNHLPGDLAEMGVYRGGSARVICEYMGSGSHLHLFDTFEGIPEDDESPHGHRAGDFATSFEDVQDFLRDHRVNFVRGRFPERLPPDSEYRFVHLDFDTYQSTCAALDYLIPRMVKGGVILCDDYGWWMCPGVQRAIHERFTAERVQRVSEYQAVIRC